MIELVYVYDSQYPLPSWIDDPEWIDTIKSKILQLHNQKYSDKPIQIHDIEIVPIAIPPHATQLLKYEVQLSKLPSVFMYKNGGSNATLLSPVLSGNHLTKQGMDLVVDGSFT